MSGETTAISKISTSDLYERLRGILQLTAQHLAEAASIVKELEERGEDLSEFKTSLLGSLRRIAYGQLLPEVVVQFSGNKMLLDKIGSLPLPDQQRLSQGESVEVLDHDEGRTSFRSVCPLDMTRSEILQVFGVGEIRSQAQQRSFISTSHLRRKGRRVFSDEHGIKIDRNKGGIVVEGVFIPEGDLLEYIKKLRGA